MVIKLNKTVTIKDTECTHADQKSVVNDYVTYSVGIMEQDDEGNDVYKDIYGTLGCLVSEAPFDVAVDEMNA